MKNLLFCLCLVMSMFGYSGTHGHADHSDQDIFWITVGSDAMKAIRAEFDDRMWRVFEQRHLTNDDVTIMRVNGEQANAISRLMHHAFKRCGGFVAHPTYEQAIATAHRELSRNGDSSKRLAVSYTLDRATEVNTVVGGITEQDIIDTIVQLSSYNSRYYTTSTSVDAANWLKGEWESYATGRSDITVELYNHSWLMPSVVMTITGAHQPQDIVVMGGHLDSTSSTSYAPGADDDASGIASLSEAIRSALANGYVPARTVKIIGYAAEEVGLRGSGDIASEAAANGDNVIGALQLDMTNYNGATNDIYLVQDYTDSSQNGFVGNLIDTYTSYSRGTINCGYACSDHASWHNNGFPASFPFEATMSTHNPNIHTPNDTYSVTGNAAHAKKFSEVAAAYMIELAKGGLNGNPGPDPGPVGGGGGGPTGTEITTNPATYSNLSGSAGGEDRYYLDIPAGATNLSISTSGGTGDVDLYYRFGAEPTTGVYDCRPYQGGNNETCTEASPSAGTHYIMLHGYSAYSGVTLNVSYDAPGGPTNNPPSSSFTYSANNLAVSFTDTSTDSDGTIASWSWNFGDGNSSSAQNPSHTYASDGTYTVSLTVTDDDGDSDTSNQSVSVTSGGGGSWVTISDTDFESGWGPYSDGGSDCRRSANDSAFAHQGSYCVRLRDDTSTSNFTTTGTIPLNGYSEAEVSFWFTANSMETGEDFFLEYFDGSTWHVVGNWARGTDFNNGSFYNETVSISGLSLNNSAKIRFRCDASGNNDQIYIDEVKVSAR